MITGFNTDVDYEGRVFHVQTEDKGFQNPIVESLVYSGGEIVASVRTSYEDLTEVNEHAEAEVLKRMEAQHRKLIRDINNGKYDPDGPKPFGYNIITNRSLDAVVLDYLSNELGVEQIRLEMDEHQLLVEGETPTLRLKVFEETTERPVAGSKVVIKLISTVGKPQQLFSGVSNDEGRIEATVEIPRIPDADTAIVCQAEAAGTNSEIKQLIRKDADADAGQVVEEQEESTAGASSETTSSADPEPAPSPPASEESPEAAPQEPPPTAGPEREATESPSDTAAASEPSPPRKPKAKARRRKGA